MDIKDIKALQPTTFDFNEVRMKQGEEGKEDDKDLSANNEESASAKKPTPLQKKRQLLRQAGAQADQLSNAQIARIAAALLHQ